MVEYEVPDFDDRLARFESATFTELRPGQRLVLREYANSHLDTPDLAIEMPTGEGKTLVALLAADWALDQGWSVAYLTGTKQLAERVEQEAHGLGLHAVRFAGKDYGGAKLDDYHQAQAVGIMNYWVYFNTKPVPQPADLVIFDDAHLAEQPLSGLQTLRVPNRPGPGRDLYGSICDLVLAHTGEAYPSLLAMRGGTAAPGTPPELLNFGDWSDIASSVRDAINSSDFADDKDARYVWPTVREHLTRCGVLIGSSAVEIRAYHPPTRLVAGYAQAKQRLYLSATLGSMDDLQRRVGGHRVRRLTPEEPLPAGATGTRQFILNSSGKPAFDDDVLEWSLSQAARAGDRAAWLCASNAEADILEDLLLERRLNAIRLRAGDDEKFDAWIAASRAHLITAGRYDGLDLPGDVCRLVIVTSVPQASSEFERFVVAYLGDASFMRHRVGQRVTQALGRANRTPNDRSMYLGLDPAFAQILADPAVRASIPVGTQPTIRQALELYDAGWDATIAACTAFWAPGEPADHGDSSLGASVARNRPRPGRAAGGNAEVASADAEVAAATDLWVGDHAAAARLAKEASELLGAAGETEHAAFWRYVEAHAHFDRGRSEDRAAARAALDEAIQQGPRTTWFRRLARTSAALAGSPRAPEASDHLFLMWDDWRREAGGKLDQALARGRKLLTGTHDEQCEGLNYLGRLCGVDAVRPPKGEQSATDCRWGWSAANRAERRAWEVKTAGARRDTDEGTPAGRKISRADVNQLLGQLEVEQRRAPRARVYGCLLDPATEAEPDATAAAQDRVRFVTHAAAVRLYDLLADRLRQYAALCGDGSAEARGEARTRVERLLPSAGWLGQLLSPAQGKILTAEDVSTSFPQR